MDKNYDPTAIEKKWIEIWEEKQCSSFTHKEGPPFCIILPPPNVTGQLHIGHAFQDTIMDFLIRYHRLQNYNTLWQVGTDHAGIATQMVVERNLQQENTSRLELGRTKFLERIWQWTEKSKNNIKNQMQAMGASGDWSRARFTLEPNVSKVVIETFVQLYREKIIYRGKKIVNWDPILTTAISDLEVINEPEEGSLWYVKYPLADHSGSIVVSTTRPETMLGDVAVAVHPEDARYKHLHNKSVILPLTERLIPIICDLSIDPNFGSGAVKITPGHDFNDFRIAELHKLPLINIFNKHAVLNENVPSKYQGLERFAARTQIIQDLKELGLLISENKHTLNLPRSDRTNTVIEPLLTDQWFIDTSKLAPLAIKAVKDKKIVFIPEHWEKDYLQWLENIQDWCISRQIWWGHQIPAWYNNGNVYVGINEDDVRQYYHLPADTKLEQDPDVLDTWFSSSLWPFSTLGWPEQTYEFKTFYPTSVLVTGFDIIFFWVARMVMMSLKFTKDIPFHHVYVHGLIQDPEGKKMSKSKGNIIDPVDLINGINLEDLLKKRTQGLMQPHLQEEISKKTKEQFPLGIKQYGADALRFTFCWLATQAKHINLDFSKLESSRLFCNKLWNASRLVIMNIQDFRAVTIYKCAPIDNWINSCWERCKINLHTHIKTYRFDLVAQALYDFTWHYFCDWYLELAKVNLQDQSFRLGTQTTMSHILSEILHFLHPVMPFLTEEIWETLSKWNDGSTLLSCSALPPTRKELINDALEKEFAWIQELILNIRVLRSNAKIPPKQLTTVYLKNVQQEEKQQITKYSNYLQSLTKTNAINYTQENPPISQIGVLGNMEIHVPVPEATQEEIKTNLASTIKKLEEQLYSYTIRLEDPIHIKKAPPQIIARDAQRKQELIIELTKLKSILKDK